MPPLPGPEAGSETVRPLDLRMPVLGVAAWSGGLAVLRLPGWASLALLTGVVLWLAVRALLRRPVLAGLACVLAAVAVGGAAAARVEANRSGPVAALAGQRAAVTVTARVTSDPVVRTGRFGSFTLVRLRVSEVVGRGQVHRSRAPVLLIGDEGWRLAELGASVTATGRLSPPDGPDLAAVLTTGRPPELVRHPGEVVAAAAEVRAGIRSSVRGPTADARALVPALVVGDDQRMSDRVVADFRTCGLTHLAAVSGTNLTLVAGFLLVLARWVGVRGRGLVVVGAAGVGGFVLLARPEPSVLRAAAMGSVALLGMSTPSRDRGVRTLGVAVLVLLLLDPWLATSAGFGLSSLATAGILLLGPRFRDALTTWLPRWAAEGLAVPLAAQLACTPLVAAISGQVSLVAVLANLLVAVAVAPATVFGLVGGLVVLAVPPLGRACGWVAGGSAWWIITVATRLARLPTAAVDWSPGVVPLVVLTVLCLVVAAGAGRVLRHPWWSAVVSIALVVVLLRPLPSPGWPPRGWVLVACDVGQGDALVLNAGAVGVVVVDAGPDPVAVAGCLRRLDAGPVAVAVLTHFHADHVDGLTGVLDGHRVGELDVTATEDPAYGARQVRRQAAASRVPVRVPAYGEVRRVGDLSWQVVGPPPTRMTAPVGEEGSAANNASLVLLVEVRGIRILLSGDMEPEAQQALARAAPALRADVLKVPHHGSRYQDPELLAQLGARLAVVSVGAGNDYGHPAASTVALLRRDGMVVERTDEEGDVAVTVLDGRLAVRTRGGP